MELRQDLFKVRNDADADELISGIKDLKADKARFEMIYKARMDQLKADLERQINTIDKEIAFNTSMLQAYFLTVKPKETKTTSKYKLLSGELVMKKQSISISKEDEEKLMKWVKESKPEFIKTKEEVNWGELKKVLKIAGDSIVTEDGEVVEGVTIKLTGEQFEIKE